MSTQPQLKYSLEEYLEADYNSEEKLEFWNGEVWSMSGASFAHNIIVRNVGTEFDLRLREKGYHSFPSDMRVKIPEYPPYRYPDLTALCGKPEIVKLGKQDLLANPQLILEVLSDSTEAFDRGDKFTYYKSIPSFSEYILIAQHRPHVTQFVKHENFWMQKEFNQLSETVDCQTVPCQLKLSEIYRGVTFSDN